MEVTIRWSGHQFTPGTIPGLIGWHAILALSITPIRFIILIQYTIIRITMAMQIEKTTRRESGTAASRRVIVRLQLVDNRDQRETPENLEFQDQGLSVHRRKAEFQVPAAVGELSPSKSRIPKK